MWCPGLVMKMSNSALIVPAPSTCCAGSTTAASAAPSSATLAASSSCSLLLVSFVCPSFLLHYKWLPDFAESFTANQVISTKLPKIQGEARKAKANINISLSTIFHRNFDG